MRRPSATPPQIAAPRARSCSRPDDRHTTSSRSSGVHDRSQVRCTCMPRMRSTSLKVAIMVLDHPFLARTHVGHRRPAQHDRGLAQAEHADQRIARLPRGRERRACAYQQVLRHTGTKRSSSREPKALMIASSLPVSFRKTSSRSRACQYAAGAAQAREQPAGSSVAEHPCRFSPAVASAPAAPGPARDAVPVDLTTCGSM